MHRYAGNDKDGTKKMDSSNNETASNDCHNLPVPQMHGAFSKSNVESSQNPSHFEPSQNASIPSALIWNRYGNPFIDYMDLSDATVHDNLVDSNAINMAEPSLPEQSTLNFQIGYGNPFIDYTDQVDSNVRDHSLIQNRFEPQFDSAAYTKYTQSNSTNVLNER